MLPPSLFLYLYFSKIHCINTSKDWHSLLFSISGPWLMLFLLPEMSFCDPPPPSTPLLSLSVHLVNTCSPPKTYFRCLFLQEAFLEGPALTSPPEWALPLLWELLAHLSSWVVVTCLYTYLPLQCKRVRRAGIGLFIMVAPVATILFSWMNKWMDIS